MQLVISLANLQKVEFKSDPNKCNVSFKNYKAGSSNALLITDVPAGAGTMLGAVQNSNLQIQPPFNQNQPVVMIEHSAIAAGAGGVDQAQYAGRIELREFV
ncbi:hypothetical protein [Leptolyngbya sp. 7M]|uniref:hypothetical protein n=1 Tax=Leptolyngbya sp. 7M TaxID=2812896 RepID=UPI001B8B12A2|nr:hypothetical protein [Leptolyngbya sp. 7M]QYO62693.1 hypothetical protein JVX88_21970 [Leptolyngbya sp. 7M]